MIQATIHAAKTCKPASHGRLETAFRSSGRLSRYRGERIDIELVRKFVAKELCRRHQSPVEDLQIQGPVYAGYNSQIYKASSSALPFDTALKFCLQSRTSIPDVHGARQQFTTLEKVAETMPAGGNYRVPQPYLLIPSHAAYMTEWVDGHSVSSRLFAPRVVLEEVVRLFDESARWLRHFHRGGLAGTGLLDTEQKLSALDELVQVRDRTSKLYTQTMNELVRSADAAKHSALQESWVHGDFKSDNLMVDGHRMVGVDIQAQTVNHVVYDIAGFLNHIDLNIHHPLRRTIRRNRRYLYGRFLDAYGPESSQELAVPVLWARTYKLLMGWTHLRQSNHAFVRSVLLERQFKWSLKSVLQELQANA